MSAKDDKMKLQSFKAWSKKHARMYALHASNSNDNDKNDHNVHIITDKDYKFNSDKLHKCSKN